MMELKLRYFCFWFSFFFSDHHRIYCADETREMGRGRVTLHWPLPLSIIQTPQGLTKGL